MGQGFQGLKGVFRTGAEGLAMGDWVAFAIGVSGLLLLERFLSTIP